MSGRRVTEYDDALRSAFGRVRDVTPAQAREAAERFEADGKDERAAQLRDYAADLELDDEGDGDKAGSSTSARSAPARSSRRRATSSGGRSGKRRRSATGRALSAAVREPDERLAGAIRSTSSTFWSAAFGSVLLIVVYLLLTRGPRSLAAIRELENGARWVVYPPAVFPSKHAERVPSRPRTRKAAP